MISQTPEPPYYAVIFTSLRTPGDDGYSSMARQLDALARLQPGYSGIESAWDEIDIIISYLQTLEAVKIGGQTPIILPLKSLDATSGMRLTN